MTLDKVAYILMVGGFLVLLYGLLGGPTAQAGVMGLGAFLGLIGLVLLFGAHRPARH